jgi:nucleoside-diphosphate-sugar epimerase
MRIAILGATSQIARDLVLSLAGDGRDDELALYARRPEAVSAWLAAAGYARRYRVADFAAFAAGRHDAVINFVAAGDPARAAATGAEYFDVTLRYDGMALDYVRANPACRYLFLSSGAAYGSRFDEPAGPDSVAAIPVNGLAPQDWIGIAKLHAECRHRSLRDSAIVDIRVFSYFSRTQDLSWRFLLADIMRAIRDGSVLETTPDYVVRDVLHPADFHDLVRALLDSPPANTAVDCYTRAPVDKPRLLSEMALRFGLRHETVARPVTVNATGVKPHYYSLNRRAAAFGYAPSRTSLEGIVEEATALLGERGGRRGETA